MTLKVALVGTGVIGRSWGIVFARAGHEVAFYDGAEGVVDHALGEVDKSLADMEAAGMIASAGELRGRMGKAASLADALDGVAYVQESVKEDVASNTPSFLRWPRPRRLMPSLRALAQLFRRASFSMCRRASDAS